MTKQLMPGYLELRATTGLNLSTLNLKVSGMSSSYSFSTAHDFFDDLTNVVQTSGNLASKTTTAGVLDAADLVLGSPAGGSTITQFMLWRDTGTPATSALIYYWDEDASGAAIAIATNGEAITITWAASGIFR